MMIIGQNKKKLHPLKVKENPDEHSSFINITMKAWTLKGCTDKLYFIDLRILCYVKNNVKKTVRQFTHREKLLTKGQNTLYEKMLEKKDITYDGVFKDVLKFNINKIFGILIKYSKVKLRFVLVIV